MATSGYPAWIRTNPSVLYSLDLFGSIIPGWNVSCRWLFLSNNWDLPLPGLIAGEQVKFSWFFLVLPECVARVPVSLWGSGGWGCVRSTSPNRPQPSATVRNRPQPFATVRNRPQPFATVRAIPVWPCLWPMASSQKGSFLEVSNVALFRFAWQAWYFVTFRRVL